jgi:hypothetical protein
MAQESARTPSSRTYKQLGVQPSLSPTFPEARAIQLTSSRSLPPAAASPSSELTAPNTGYRFVHRKPKAKRNRKGSGPYKSVIKERSVEFNLTLDVQTLRQQIQQLTTTRDLLQSRKLQFRHSPTGSLMQVVREFFQLFRQGFRVEQHTSRRRVITAGVQRDFLYSVVDEQIDFGNGLGGIAFMVEMIRRYSLLLRFIRLQMDSYDIVRTGDHGEDVLITAQGSIRFQVLRETIVGLFPHIVGNETLCARLIGADVEAAVVVSFYFGAHGRIVQYAFDVDYVECFSRVLRGDLASVAALLDRSKIGEKSMFGVSKDGQLEHVELYDEQYASHPGAGVREDDTEFEVML